MASNLFHINHLKYSIENDVVYMDTGGVRGWQFIGELDGDLNNSAISFGTSEFSNLKYKANV